MPRKDEDAMFKCPHCGGANGFTYLFTMTTKRMGDWDMDNDEEIEIKDARFPKTVVCKDCGKRVEFKVAHGKTLIRNRMP